jgi:hypothetical protein
MEPLILELPSRLQPGCTVTPFSTLSPAYSWRPADQIGKGSFQMRVGEGGIPVQVTETVCRSVGLAGFKGKRKVQKDSGDLKVVRSGGPVDAIGCIATAIARNPRKSIQMLAAELKMAVNSMKRIVCDELGPAGFFKKIPSLLLMHVVENTMKGTGNAAEIKEQGRQQNVHFLMKSSLLSMLK